MMYRGTNKEILSLCLIETVSAAENSPQKPQCWGDKVIKAAPVI